MNHHGQRRPQQRVPQIEQERLQQVLQRLKSALQLGLKPTLPGKVGGKKWCNADAEVQVQAVRAISALVPTLTAHSGRSSSLQVALEESVATLESLLGAEREIVFSKAADTTAALVAVMGDGLLAYGGKRLLGPLAHLLKSSKLSTSISAATALHGILVKIKPGTGIKGSDDSTWKALEGADILVTIENVLQEDRDSNSKDAAFLELITVIVERWPQGRFRVGSVSSFRTTLFLRCTSNSEAVAQAALRAASALALCGCVATLMLENASNLWSTIFSCLKSSNHFRIQLEAFRFLSTLCKASAFGASFTGPHVAAIAAGCLRALEQARRSREGKWNTEVELLIVEAAHATSSVLSWPGSHHTFFLENGIEKLLLAVLSGVQNKGDKRSDSAAEVQHPQLVLNHSVDRRSRANKWNPRLRPLLWEILGWLGAHHCTDVESSYSPVRTGLGKSDNKLFVLACTALLRALCKRGQSPVWFQMEQSEDVKTVALERSPEEQAVSAQEVVQISKAVLLLLSSPSQSISSRTKMCLEDTLASYGLDWLPSLVNTTALGVSKTVKIDHLQSMTNLLAVACISWVEACRDQLLKFEVLKVVLGIIEGQTDSDDQVQTERLSAMSTSLHSVGCRACCFHAESWEGKDSVLFTALWALPKLLQGSAWAKAMRGSVTDQLLHTSNWSEIEDGHYVQLLLKVAGDSKRSEGVRWWSVCSLAFFGIYGFPSRVGQDIKRAFDDQSLADVIFVLGDGSRLRAHGVVLAARCELLLPAELQARACKNSDFSDSHGDNKGDAGLQQLNGVEPAKSASEVMSTPAELHVSPRLTNEVLKSLLEFVYAGIVCVPSGALVELRLVAKKCRLEPLTSLLQGKSPTWGQSSAPCDLAPALGSKGDPLSDVMLQAGKGRLGDVSTSASEKIYAHRFVLSARCNYFQALFRSGMRDSTQKVLEMQANRGTIVKLLQYLYSGEAKSEVADCAWTNLGIKAQLEYLRALLELADLAGQWLMDELQQLTWALMGMYLKSNVHLCPPIMSLAVVGQQWVLVETCAECLAPEYVQLRDSGALDSLNEELTDFVRDAHVKLFLSGKLGDSRPV